MVPHNSNTTSREMALVILAMIPGLFALGWIFGPGVWIHSAIAVPTAIVAEAAILLARGRNPMGELNDLSAILTALLLAVSLPPLLPWWMVLLGTGFAIILAKQLYGGLGQNPFNPAMIGYVILLVSFPKEMTSWLSASGMGGETISWGAATQAIFGGAPVALDSLSGATPLGGLKTTLAEGLTLQESLEKIPSGLLAGPGWEWVNFAFLFGGTILLLTRTISWHIPVSVLAGLSLVALIFNTIDPASYATPLYHLLSGGIMLGAFFIATDPVTASTTPMGRIWFGLGIGVLDYIIRTWGGYPDAVAFSVLLMNMFAPLIDHFTQPTIYGAQKGEKA
ncbi:MAG: RnfABCDGE type electron transport complex subunit D [Gammaproteobacteria bacterium]|nr:RnfABCDGE type electron transport complex subunit D [Gammaproteobacteria bacterium]